MKKQQNKTSSDNSSKLHHNIEELRLIVEKLGQQNTSIEFGIQAFGQGIELARQSLDILNSYKGQLKELKLQADELVETDLIL